MTSDSVLSNCHLFVNIRSILLSTLARFCSLKPLATEPCLAESWFSSSFTNLVRFYGNRFYQRSCCSLSKRPTVKRENLHATEILMAQYSWGRGGGVRKGSYGKDGERDKDNYVKLKRYNLYRLLCYFKFLLSC